ncbi:Holliday junction resolvase RuvX [uncultured Jatrophihabitans sp.]|uniref:Holliday junction resolvase RuvX n=1 Tax=uncultured Jatrophihabitans sp. TaxID=1610747 RepID=UPI0035CC6AF5
MPEPTPRPAGVWFAVDVGTVRVGIARSDPRGVLALPVTTLRRDRKRNTDVAELVDLGREYEAVGFVVGLPRTLAGREGPSAAMAREFGTALERRLSAAPDGSTPVVEYLDERLTTVSAQRKLSQGGIRGQTGRAIIDQAAAVELLQHWLDSDPSRRS